MKIIEIIKEIKQFSLIIEVKKFVLIAWIFEVDLTLPVY